MLRKIFLLMIASVLFPLGAPRAAEGPPPAPEILPVKRLWYGTIDVDSIMGWGTSVLPTSNRVNDIAVFPDGGLAGLLTVQQRRYGRAKWDTVRIVRFDRRGRVLWDRSYEATDRWYVHQQGEAIAAMPDGGLAIIGANGYSEKDFWVLRLDGAGGPMWRARFEGGDGKVSWPRDMAALPDGGVVVAAEIWTSGADASDAWILRLDPDGKVLWEIRIDWGHRNTVYRLSTLSDGRATAIISAQGPIMDERPGEMWAVRLDRAGAVQWRRRFEAGSNPYPTSDGGLVLCGSGRKSNSAADRMFVRRFDSTGNLQWRRRVRPQPPVSREKLEELFAGICVELSDGGVAFGTEHEYLDLDGMGTVRELWLGRLDREMQPLWLRRAQLPGPEESYYLEKGLEPGPDGSFFVYGMTYSYDGLGIGDRQHIWIDKVPPE